MKIEEKTFAQFTPATLDFLANVHGNNSRTWYEEHKEEYKQVLVEPLHVLTGELSGLMQAIDPLIVVNPRKTTSRIHRDTRFSKNKSLYKRAMWLTFKRPSESWSDSPAFYFEITPEFYRYGMGFYMATSSTMTVFRQSIDAQPKEFLAATAFYRNDALFTLEGERYKRSLGVDKPPEIQPWYQMKNFYLVRDCPIDERLFSKELVGDLQHGFSLLAPLYHYLWTLKDWRP